MNYISNYIFELYLNYMKLQSRYSYFSEQVRFQRLKTARNFWARACARVGTRCFFLHKAFVFVVIVSCQRVDRCDHRRDYDWLHDDSPYFLVASRTQGQNRSEDAGDNQDTPEVRGGCDRNVRPARSWKNPSGSVPFAQAQLERRFHQRWGMHALFNCRLQKKLAR